MTDNSPDINNPEVLLVAGALLKPQLAPEAAQYVDVEDFTDSRLKLIWAAIVGMLDDGYKADNIDPVGVGRRCGDTPEKQMVVATFCDNLVEKMPRLSSLVMSAHRVRRRATMRLALERMRELATDLKQQIESNDGDAPDLDEKLTGLAVAVSKRADKSTRRVVFKDMARDVMIYFDRIATHDTRSAIPTGLARLDDFLGGGMRPGQLHVVLASTGDGKTAFASQICDYAVASGKRAIMFSMEVDPQDIFIRDVERHAGVSRWDLRYANTKDETISKISKSMGAMIAEAHHKIIYGEPISVEGIRQAVLTERLRTGPIDMIVVDHAQVALPSPSEQKTMPRYLAVKNTAEGLRALARQLNVAVVLTAQMNPAPKGETPSMTMVRESKDINHAAEVVIVLWHEKSEQIDGSMKIDKTWIRVEKARAGREGKIEARYNGKLFQFEEVRYDPYAG